MAARPSRGVRGSDSIAPTGTMSVNNGAAYTGTTAATVNSNVTDNVAVTQMQIDPGTGTFGSWVTYVASAAITLPSGTGHQDGPCAVPRRGGQHDDAHRHDRPRHDGAHRHDVGELAVRPTRTSLASP